MNQNKFKTIITSTVCTLAMASSCFGADFKDIDDVPWDGAKTFIKNVADLGLMVGDEDDYGKKVFRSRDKVTYCETMQLAYSIMDKTNKKGDASSLVSKWSTIMSGNKIPEWAYPAVSYGLDKGIVSISDVSRFMSASGANNFATREDVAVIIGKTLGTIYSVDKNATLTFKDKSKVAPTSVPYVALLANMDILVGDDDGYFYPRNYINRAEMSVVVSKSYNKIKGGGNTSNPNPSVPTDEVVTGTILSTYDYGNTYMITLNVNGVNTGYIGDNSIPVTYNGEKQLWSDLTAGDEVTINLDKDGQPESVKITFDFISSKTETVEGTIETITNKQIVLKTSSGYSTYDIDSSDTSLTLDGSKSSIKEYVEAIDDDGYKISAKVEVKGGKQAVSIVGTTSSETKTGTLISISDSKIKYKKSGSTYTYDIADNATFKLDGDKSTASKIEKALDDDDETLYVKVTLNTSDEARIIEAYYDDTEEDYDGVIEDIDSKEIEIDNGSRKKTYKMASSVTYRLDGSSSTLSKIQKAVDDGDVNVIITLDTNDKVSKVEAFTESNDGIKGKITDITSSKIYFKKSGSSSTDKYDYDEDDISIKVDSRSRDIDYLRDYLDDEDSISATITLDRNKNVTKIIASKTDSSDDALLGQIYSVDDDEIRFSEFDSSTKKYYDLARSSKLTVKIKDKTKDIDDLIDYWEDESNVYAKIKIEDDKVTYINASNKKSDITSQSSSSSDEVEDIIVTYASKKTVKYKTSTTSSEKSKDMASKVTIKIDGSTSDLDELKDLISDDILLEGTLSLNSDGEVDRITVTSSESLKGTLNYIYEGTINITPSGSSSKKSYDVVDSYYLTIKLDGRTVSLEDLSDKLERYDISVKLTRNSRGEVVTIIAETK